MPCTSILRRVNQEVRTMGEQKTGQKRGNEIPTVMVKEYSKWQLVPGTDDNQLVQKRTYQKAPGEI